MPEERESLVASSKKAFQKIKTAVIFGVTVVGLLLVSHAYPIFFLLLLFLLATLGLNEFFDLFPTSLSLLYYPLLWSLILSFLFSSATIPFVIFLLLFLPAFFAFGQQGEVPPIKEIALAQLGVVYLSLYFFPLHLFLKEGLSLIVLALVLTWANDVFAYFIGQRFGRRKLCPALSPHKTVEGALGGLAGALLAALLFRAILNKWHPISLPFSVYALIGLGGAIAAQLGDLFESSLKRTAGVKDSGSLLPEHGGILDRFDSFLFVSLFLDAFLIHIR